MAGPEELLEAWPSTGCPCSCPRCGGECTVGYWGEHTGSFGSQKGRKTRGVQDVFCLLCSPAVPK